MSVDNSIARSREAEPQAERPSFDLPLEILARYRVREVQSPDGAERRIGLFLPADRQNPAIEIAGDRIITHKEDPETVASLVKIAQHDGWDRIDVDGSPEFRKAVYAAATREGITVRGYEPTFAEREQMEASRRAAVPKERENAGAAELAPVTVADRTARDTAGFASPQSPPLPPARPDFDVGVEGTIVEVGRARFDDKATRDTPYVDLELSDGRKERAWGVGLPDALQGAGKEVGDAVRLQRLGVEPVEVAVQVRDPETGRVSSEQRLVHRNQWAVEGRALEGDASRDVVAVTAERGDDPRRPADGISGPQQTFPRPAGDVADATIPARSAEAVRGEADGRQPTTAGATELSDGDRRLLLTLSRFTEDHRELYKTLDKKSDPLSREVQLERIDVNREAFGNALERALESPTLVKTFERSGYEPEELRQMGKRDEWDLEVPAALYLVHSGLHRDGGPSRVEMTVVNEIDADREQRLVDISGPQQTPPRPVVDVGDQTIPARSAGAVRGEADGQQPTATGAAELSDGDRRLLLTLSRFTEDHRDLYKDLDKKTDPLSREVQLDRIDVNREALGNALERALESPTLVKTFERSGYGPEELRQMGKRDEWDLEVPAALHLVRSGLHRDGGPSRVEATATMVAEIDAGREQRSVAASSTFRDRPSEPEPRPMQDRQGEGSTGLRRESDELAELFLHGSSEKLASDPRLANALHAQSTMEKHISEVFEGDASRTAAANLESRQMISDVLRRGLDVSVREPTAVRQIEPIQTRPDLER